MLVLHMLGSSPANNFSETILEPVADKQNYLFYITVIIYCFLALMPVSILNEAGWVKALTLLESHYNMLACATVLKKGTCLYPSVGILLIICPAKVANTVKVKAPMLPQMSM